ncbi:MAG: protein kinase [Polyangia bacterium]
MPSTAGRIIDGRYRLVRLIGDGGMGSVHEASHARIDRKVAIKLLHPDFVANQEALERFSREARAASSIGHPNIVEIYDLGREPDGTAFMVMELLDGEDLGSTLARQGALSPARAVAVALQVLSALHEVHRHEIVHRDMKPENVFLSTDAAGRESVKLLDFGVAKIQQGMDSENLTHTRTGTVLGTPYYMSPEIARGGRRFDHRVDLWAVGVMLYEMVSGQRPFEGEGYNEILASILMEDARPLREVAPSVPPRLTEIVDRALRKDPDERYSSAGEMLADLLPLHDDRSAPELTSSAAVAIRSQASTPFGFVTPTRGSTPVPAARESQPTGPLWLLDSAVPGPSRPARRRLWIAAAIAASIAVALLSGAGLAFLLTGEEPSADFAARTATAAAPSTPDPEPEPALPAASKEPLAEKPAGPVTVELSGLPDDAGVEIDGRSVVSPFEVARSDRAVELVVTAKGYSPFEFELVPDRDREIEVEMERVERNRRPAAERSGKRKRRNAEKKGGKVWATNPFGE